MKDTLALSIEGMHCGACIRRVTNALQGVPGVEIDTVNVGSAKLKFASDQTTPAEIEAAVNRTGFNAHIER
jgi:copper chaperone